MSDQALNTPECIRELFEIPEYSGRELFYREIVEPRRRFSENLALDTRALEKWDERDILEVYHNVPGIIIPEEEYSAEDFEYATHAKIPGDLKNIFVFFPEDAIKCQHERFVGASFS